MVLNDIIKFVSWIVLYHKDNQIFMSYKSIVRDKSRYTVNSGSDELSGALIQSEIAEI